jgi:hypothetical protein
LALTDTFLLKIRRNDELIRKLCLDENYQILEDGKILTLVQRTGKISKNKEWRLLSDQISSEGYITHRYNYKYLSAHRTVYQKFIGDLDYTKQINHKDGNRQNNHYSNLELVSQSENGLHSFRVLKRKPVYGFCKINFEIAEEIRLQRGLGFSYKYLSEKFNISESSVADILAYRTWKPKSEAS